MTPAVSVGGLAQRQFPVDGFAIYAEPGSMLTTVITSHLAVMTVVGRLVTNPDIAWLTCPLAVLAVVLLTRGFASSRRVIL